MPISSLIVKVTEEKTKDITRQIAEIAGASVSDVVEGKLVVLTESEHRQEDKRIWESLEAIEGVISVDLIYHNFEDLEEE